MLPDVDWGRVARITVAWLRRTAHARGRDHALISCLQRPELLSQEDREYLIRDAGSFLAVFTVADSFADRLRALVSRAASPSGTVPRRAALIDRQLSASLRALAEDVGSTVPQGLFRQGLRLAEDLIADDRPSAAGHYLVPLLPLATRISADDLARVTELAVMALTHPLQDDRSRASFVHTCERLAATGAWDDDSVAQATIESLRAATETPRLSERLWFAAVGSDPVALDLVERGAEHAEQLVAGNRPGAAAYSVAPLLPLCRAVWEREYRRADRDNCSAPAR